jgi:hypothetical protein
MAVFFIIPAVVGALTIGSTAYGKLHEKQAHHPSAKASQTVMAPAFDAGAYASVSDCLTAAALAGAPLASCSSSAGPASDQARGGASVETHTAAAPSFDTAAYGTISDCLTAASRQGAPLASCESVH